MNEGDCDRKEGHCCHKKRDWKGKESWDKNDDLKAENKA